MTARTRIVTAAALVIGVAFWAASIHANVYTYTGGHSDPNDWQQAANWTGGTGDFPGSSAGETAIIPDGYSPSFTNMPHRPDRPDLPGTVFAITTGNTPVAFGSGINIGGPNNATLTIGSGGATFGGTIGFPNQGGRIIANGDLTAPATSFSNGGHSITQSPGVIFDINTFNLRDFPIVDWNFAPGKPVSFTGTMNATYTFAETPVFSPGHRPNWTMSAGGADVKWDLNGQTLLGDALSLAGHPNLDRHSYLFNDVPGAVIDVNSISLNAPNEKNYLDLSDTTVTIRGSGLAWNMTSIRNTEFDITDNTTVIFDPDGGALSINTGSYDYGTGMGDGSFLLGNEDNFVFDEIILRQPYFAENNVTPFSPDARLAGNIS